MCSVRLWYNVNKNINEGEKNWLRKKQDKDIFIW